MGADESAGNQPLQIILRNIIVEHAIQQWSVLGTIASLPPAKNEKKVNSSPHVQSRHFALLDFIGCR